MFIGNSYIRHRNFLDSWQLECYNRANIYNLPVLNKIQQRGDKGGKNGYLTVRKF